MISIKEKVENIRKDNNLSVEELAKKIGVGQSILYKISKSDNHYTPDIAYKVCFYFGLNPEDVVEFKNINKLEETKNFYYNNGKLIPKFEIKKEPKQRSCYNKMCPLNSSYKNRKLGEACKCRSDQVNTGHYCKNKDVKAEYENRMEGTKMFVINDKFSFEYMLRKRERKVNTMNI